MSIKNYSQQHMIYIDHIRRGEVNYCHNGVGGAGTKVTDREKVLALCPPDHLLLKLQDALHKKLQDSNKFNLIFKASLR